MSEVKLYKRLVNSIKILLVGLIFTILGISGLILNFLPTWISCVLIIIFGLVFLSGMIQLLDRKPVIIVDEKGIYYKDTLVYWEELEDALFFNLKGQKYLCLIAGNKVIMSKQLMYKPPILIPETMGKQTIYVLLNSIDVKAGEFYSFVKEAIILAKKNGDND